MIVNIENAKFLSDAQWIRLMEIVGNKKMKLIMPTEEGAHVFLIYDGAEYKIEVDGGYHCLPNYP